MKRFLKRVNKKGILAFLILALSLSALVVFCVLKDDTTSHKMKDGVCSECGIAQSSEGLEFKLNEDGKTYTLTGIGTCTAKNVVVGIYNNSDVTTIADTAFYKAETVESVTIESCVTEIGYLAFYGCEKLIKVENGVEYVDNWVIGCDEKLSSVTLRAETRGIAVGAFYNCDDLAEISISEMNESFKSVEGILYSKDSKTLVLYPMGRKETSFSVPNFVEKISKYAFGNCDSLSIVMIPESVTSIDAISFYECGNLSNIYVDSGNTAYKSVNGDLYTKNGEVLVKYSPAKGDTFFAIPEGVKKIEDQAFYKANNLKNVTIPDSVTEIGVAAFFNCKNLSSITIPSGVESIGHNAFYACRSMMSATILGSCQLGERAFFECNNLVSVTITGKVDEISNYAFAYCSKLSNVTLPTGLSKIGKEAFLFCKLKNIVIPDSVVRLESGAFLGCEYLESINIPDSVESIDESVFSGCEALTTVTIGKGLAEIGGSAFGYVEGDSCESLVNIFVDSENKNYKSIDGNLYSKDGKTLVIYAMGKDYEHFQIPEGVEVIGEHAFNYCENLTGITIPKSVKIVGANAFNKCGNLKGVYITDLAAWCRIEFANINANPLCNAKNLYLNGKLITDLVIPDGVTKINRFAFVDADHVTRVTIPDSVTVIDTEAFAYSNKITTLNMGNSVESIGANAFINCNNLTGVTVPSSLKSVGKDAFLNCKALAFVNISDIAAWCRIEFANTNANPIYLSKNLYLNGELITNLVIPNGVTGIKPSAFINCDSIVNVMIPDGVEKICSNAFKDCSSLTNVTILSDVDFIGSNAFGNCDNLSSIIFNDARDWYYIDGNAQGAYTNCMNKTGGIEINIASSDAKNKLKGNYYFYKR